MCLTHARDSCSIACLVYAFDCHWTPGWKANLTEARREEMRDFEGSTFSRISPEGLTARAPYILCFKTYLLRVSLRAF